MTRTFVMNCLLNKYTLIVAGGGLGSLLRYLVEGWAQSLTRGTFPLGTMIVNVLGCFTIGVLNQVFVEHIPIRMEYRVGLTVGILGGFTTFSALGWESFKLANEGQGVRAMLNLLLTVTLGFVAVWLGFRLAQRWFGA